MRGDCYRYDERRKYFNRQKEARGCDHCKRKDIPAHSLEYHHRDPEQKKFNVNLANIMRDPVQFAREMRKCDLLCKDCHILADEKIKSRGRPTRNYRPPDPGERQLEFGWFC